MIMGCIFLAYFAFFFGLLHVLARREAVKKFINRCDEFREEKRWTFLPGRNDLVATFLLWTVGTFLIGVSYLETKNYWTNPLRIVIYWTLGGIILLAVRVVADNLPLGRLMGRYSLAGWLLFATDAFLSSSLILGFIRLIESYNTMNYASLFQGIGQSIILLAGAILTSEFISYYLWICSRKNMH